MHGVRNVRIHNEIEAFRACKNREEEETFSRLFVFGDVG